jgi:hypothetical protein
MTEVKKKYTYCENPDIDPSGVGDFEFENSCESYDSFTIKTIMR